MSKNGKSSLTPKAKGAAMRNREKMYYKALSFGIYNKPKSIADLCHEAWAAGYFYAKQESELFYETCPNFSKRLRQIRAVYLKRKNAGLERGKQADTVSD